VVTRLNSQASESSDISIRTVGLSKNYGTTQALVDCDLEVPTGRFMALVGPNGAGKSTLLLMLIGLLKPTTGHILIAGLEPRQHRREVLNAVGFVAQDRPLYQALTVRETLEMGSKLNDTWDGEGMIARMEKLSIGLDTQVRRLSGGQQAQVSLSLALGKRPALLILDEPMASLDPLARHHFLAEVVAAADERRLTVIMSSHIIAELGRVCNYVAILERGHLVACGSIGEVIESLGARNLADYDPLGHGMTDLEQVVLWHLSRST